MSRRSTAAEIWPIQALSPHDSEQEFGGSPPTRPAITNQGHSETCMFVSSSVQMPRAQNADSETRAAGIARWTATYHRHTPGDFNSGASQQDWFGNLTQRLARKPYDANAHVAPRRHASPEHGVTIVNANTCNCTKTIHCVAVPEHWVAVPEHWVAVPEHWVAVPGHWVAVPEHWVAVPEH